MNNITCHCVLGLKSLILIVLSTLLFSTALLAVEEEIVDDKTPKVPVTVISVTGVGGVLYKNLNFNIPSNIPDCQAEKEQIEHFIKAIKKRFRKASRAVGYYDAEFSANIRSIENCWKITVDVNANRPVKVVQAHFKIKGAGLSEASFQMLNQQPPYEEGDVLNHEKYTDYKKQLKAISEGLGYFNAAFETREIKVNPITYTATVMLVFLTGKRFRYGEIKVDQTVLDNNIIQQFLQIKAGDVYSAEALIQQQQLLQNSGYYSDISIAALHQQAVEQRVPIEIKLTAKKRNAYQFKVGYGTDTGPRLSAELNRRWTGGQGRRLNLKATASPILSSFTARLTQPKSNPKDDVLSYLFEWKQDISSNEVVSLSLKLGMEYTRKTKQEWQETASISYLRDTTEAGGDKTESELTLLGIRTEKTKADNLIFPLNGWHLKGELQGALENVLSDQSILQFKGGGKLITSQGKGRILNRLKLGYTLVGESKTLPKSLRFFAGGGQSVRGYGFQLLGTKNDKQQLIGGQHLLTGSIEYEHPIIDKWSAAVFFDAGDAFDDWKSMELKWGVGFGGRWRSPVGPVRIDIAWPKDRLADPRLHLSIGSDL
ncbi:MAG: outer membrane protein assembly factor [Cocleimonas sp.]|nr:outer membrane protein assembly factor [Cocleimonas sp.]